MKFNDPKVIELFGPLKKYEVPPYQRGYNWKQKLQIQDLWDDLESASSQNPLYLGPIILQKSAEDESLMLIVDGQQRITTLMLFFIAARNIAIKNNFPQASTLPNLIASSNTASGGIEEPRLKAGENVKEALDYLIKEPEYNGGQFPRNIDGRKARVLKNNYIFFHDKLSSLNSKELEILLKGVLENSFFSRSSC